MEREQKLIRAVRVVAVAQAGFALGCAAVGTPLFPWAPAAADLAVAAGAAVALAATFVRALLRPACLLAVASGFGLLTDVLVLLFGSPPDSPAGFLNHVLALVLAVLLAAVARPGPAVVRGRPPEPSAASRRVHLASYAATAAFVPYVAMKSVWAFGGTFAGVSGAEVLAASERNGASGLWLALESRGLDPTVLLALLGVFLLYGLIRPWGQVFPRWTLPLAGRRVPRWLPLTPAVLGAATLVPYGLAGLGYLALAATGAVDLRRGELPDASSAVLVGWTGMVAFACYGLALAAAARSYLIRTRPVPR